SDAGKSPDAPTPASAAPPEVAGTPAATDPDDAPRTHIVERGESAWIIARRYHIDIAQLLERNGLDTSSTLQPGMVLALDAQPAESGAAAASVAH
ncbi:MAG: LysM peptidoglycan-binding domain-containing protein, partial [Lysobacter sp.]|nr:LysM peptidoglycan-binding domain-containing protein [Lysobacter sp.]